MRRCIFEPIAYQDAIVGYTLTTVLSKVFFFDAFDWGPYSLDYRLVHLEVEIQRVTKSMVDVAGYKSHTFSVIRQLRWSSIDKMIDAESVFKVVYGGEGTRPMRKISRPAAEDVDRKDSITILGKWLSKAESQVVDVQSKP